MEHCPYENLKASAVSWIKGETLEANLPGAHAQMASIFATPVALQTLSPFLFPDVTQTSTSTNIVERWTVFRTSLSFYLATLNFYYLLLCAKHLHQRLEIRNLHVDSDVGGSYLDPLRKSSKQFSESLTEGALRNAEDDSSVELAKSDLVLLDDVLSRVEQGVVRLAQES